MYTVQCHSKINDHLACILKPTAICVCVCTCLHACIGLYMSCHACMKKFERASFIWSLSHKSDEYTEAQDTVCARNVIVVNSVGSVQI